MLKAEGMAGQVGTATPDGMLRHLPIEVKFDTPSDTGEFTGIASVFGEVDALGDTIQRGAFAKSLAEHKAKGRVPLMLWSHQLDQPIGRWTEIRETAEGLVVKGKLLLDVARAREVYAMLKEKVVDGLSIGFRTVKSSRTKAGRLLQGIDLAEISLVTLPALASARVTSVKSTQPRREPAHPVEGPPSHDLRIVRSGRRAGPVPISRSSIAHRAYRDRRDPRR
jgi:HK97 family phage prohead protease